MIDRVFELEDAADAKDIGLWGEGVREAFTDMGAIGFADVESEAVLAEDQRVAEQFDATRFEHGPAA